MKSRRPKVILFLFLGVCAAVTIFIAYIIVSPVSSVASVDPDLFEEEEDRISEKVSEAKWDFIAESGSSQDLEMSWEKESSILGNEVLRMGLNSRNAKIPRGLLLAISIPLHQIVDGGLVEFWVKAENERKISLNVEIRLKEFASRQQQVVGSFLLIADGEWRRQQLPLRGFQVSDKEKETDFSWEIREINFLTPLLPSGEVVNLFIKGFKVMEGNTIYCELF